MKVKELKKIIDEELPTNWLHPVFEDIKWVARSSFNPKDIENLLLKIRDRINKRIEDASRGN